MLSRTQEKWAEGFIQYKNCIECRQYLVLIYKIYEANHVCTSTARVCINPLCFHYIDLTALESWTTDPHFLIQPLPEERLPSPTQVARF